MNSLRVPRDLQRMQIRQQILDVLGIQLLAVSRHFIAAQADDVGYALVIRRQPAQGKIFVLEDSLETRAFLAARRVRLMAPGAIVVVESSAFGLLRVEAEFSVGLAPLDIAAGEREKREDHHRGTEVSRKPVREVHDDCGVGSKNRAQR